MPPTGRASRTPSRPRCLADLDVHLIADNYATHKTAPDIRNWFAKAARNRFHRPTSASWLNLVERWFGLAHRKAGLRRGVHQTGDCHQPSTWTDTKEDPKPFVWTKTADQTWTA